MKFIRAVSIISIILLCSIAFAQQKVWVTSTGAALKEMPTASSKTIENLPVGAELTVQNVNGKWHNVKNKAGKQGWVYSGKVGTNKPAASQSSGQKEAGLGDLLGGISGNNVQASSAQTTRSMRGLSPDTNDYAKQTGKSKETQAALNKILSKNLKSSDIDKFLKDGRIGEYAD